MTATAISTSTVSRKLASGSSTWWNQNNIRRSSKLAQETRLTRESVWFNGQPLAQIETATSAVHTYFNDHLGTPLLTTNSSGAVDWRVEREPFGSRSIVRAGADRYQPLAFPGQEDDTSTDRSYNIFRHYRSSWGRYSQSDPMGLNAGPNLFTYVFNNPLKLIDRFGLVAELVCKNVGTGGKKIAGAYHCRVRASCNECNKDGQPASDNTFGMEFTGNPPYSINKWPYPSGLEGYTITIPITLGGSSCQFSKCINAYNKVFQNGYTGQGTKFVPPYWVTGPNSNTYASKLIETCGGSAAFPPGAIGSGYDPSSEPATPWWE